MSSAAFFDLVLHFYLHFSKWFISQCCLIINKMDYIRKIRLSQMSSSHIHDIPVFLVAPGNFDSTKHIISGVSRIFQFCPTVALSDFSKKLV